MSLRRAQQPDRSEHCQHALDGSEDQGRPVPASKELLKHSKLSRNEHKGHRGAGGNQCDEALPAEPVRTAISQPCLEAAMPRANSAMQAGHSTS